MLRQEGTNTSASKTVNNFLRYKKSQQIIGFVFTACNPERAETHRRRFYCPTENRAQHCKIIPYLIHDIYIEQM